MRQKTHFVCQACGYVSSKWMGRCPACGEWNTLVEEVTEKKAARSGSGKAARVERLSDLPPEGEGRFESGIPEVDRVLGGGIVGGSLLLLGGDPGVGKSTLLLEVAGTLGKRGIKTLYVSAEESPRQLAMRARRLGLDLETINVSGEVVVEEIIRVVEGFGPQALFIDSVQTVFMEALASSPGSVSQVRETGGVFLRLAKEKGISVFLVGHVTKEGIIAGPRTLEHMVDVVLYLEGEKGHSLRVLRSPKNRFGPTDETGLFEMTENGLVPVSSLSLVDLTAPPVPGVAAVPVMEGARPLMVELQALVSFNPFPVPTRRATGYDYGRFAMLLAVLEKRAGIRIRNQDVYVNVAGGLRIYDPGADLALAVAIASANNGFAVDRATVFIGEIGLVGEIRPVKGLRQRLMEAKRAGFRRALIPGGEAMDLSAIEINGVSSLREALELMK
ncbi:MAG: DNA repair protein RadA [candidate division WOR-3 bacterium]